MYAESLINTDKIDESHTVLEQLNIDFNGLTKIQKLHMKSYLDYVWGIYYFKKDDLVSAKSFAEKSIKDYKAELDIYLTNSLLLLGKIHDLKGHRSKAKNAYKKCIELDNNSTAVNLAKIYMETPYRK